MKKYFSLTALAVLVLLTVSCNNEDSKDPDINDDKLKIQTVIQEQLTYAPVSDFSEGSALSLFVTTGELGANYPTDPFNNLKTVLNTTGWQIQTSVRLSGTEATVFAFYPYTTTLGNGTSIELDHTKQIGYMFGSNSEGEDPVTAINPKVRLTMRHAQAMIQFILNKKLHRVTG
ncbi:hypothetical protein GGR21_001321 [Dysgonomonas hofstadii]|uniref:Uncharacterized protein n=1 Tax=Dysgonomonas hofstadii TaxID=637886 RepID=A0A840CN03_9BACT|nr:fimbrillin family protein [Dysgonomonas hofstadii]MBB4035428.1 hypothetical protein [Dysgonomonas hofstadii]